MGLEHVWSTGPWVAFLCRDRYARLHPTLVKGLENVFITQICGKYDHMMALDEKGKVYTWGKRQALAGKPKKVII